MHWSQKLKLNHVKSHNNSQIAYIHIHNSLWFLFVVRTPTLRIAFFYFCCSTQKGGKFRGQRWSMVAIEEIGSETSRSAADRNINRLQVVKTRQFVSSHRDFHILFLHQSPGFSTQLGPCSTYQSPNRLYRLIALPLPPGAAAFRH